MKSPFINGRNVYLYDIYTCTYNDELCRGNQVIYGIIMPLKPNMAIREPKAKVGEMES